MERRGFNQQKILVFKPKRTNTLKQPQQASADPVSLVVDNYNTVRMLQHVNQTVCNKAEDWSIKFEMELDRCKQTVNQLNKELKQHLNILSQKTNSKKAAKRPNSFQKEKVSAIEAEIHELEMQMLGAHFGYDRASQCADVEMRMQRECFRLASRLPALSKRIEFEEKVTQSQFLVVMGQTGSGKSTQLTQYLADMPEFEKKYVICTQPRKIAALSLSKRVAFEFAAGKETNLTKKWVGYHVSGDKRLDPNSRILYMTETILLNQLTKSLTGFDPFKNCCAVIVDEAHSRNITTDVLLGVLKKQIHLWPHLKVIVTSATIDTNLFSRYLNNCPVIEIPGRLYPVEVIYRPFDRDHGNVIEAVVNQALNICNNYKTGDILCFLTGQNEVEWAKQKCSVSIKSSKLANEQISVFALYGKQSPEEQQKVFIRKLNERKIIFATDIAETSVTIDGIVFIVDSGFTKNLVFDSTRNITSLKEMMISASSAEQRKGRAGRTAPGVCYRMYSEEDYESMPKFDKAEIFLRPLGITVTLLKAMSVDPFNFEWLEPPDRVALEIAMEELLLLGALDHRHNLTGLGTLISELQIDPGIARMLHYACSKGLGQVSTILAGLFSVSSMVFWRGSDEDTQRASNEAKKRFFSDHGDIVSLYKVFTEWKAQREADPKQKKVKAWCMVNFVNHKAMNMVLTTAKEIETYMLRGASYLWKKCQMQNLEATNQDLQQLAAQAFLLNVALLVNKNYIALRADVLTYVHPGSIFFRDKEMPKVIAFQSILRTSKAFAMQITPIEIEWIQEGNEVLFAMYDERLQQVNSCEAKVSPVSRGILRFILGPGNRNIDQMNQQLDSFVYGDFENDSLTAWCKPAACSLITRELNRLVSNRKAELESMIREDSLIGETRIVWSCGGEGKMLLFSGDFIGINIRNVPKTWNLVDLDLTVRQKLSQQLKESIRDLFFLLKSEDQSKKSARIFFDSPLIAAAAIKELSKSDGTKLEFAPALSNRPSAYKEPEAWLNVSFALGATQKSAILTYSSAQDANAALNNRPFSSMSPSRPKKTHPNKQDDLRLGQNYDPPVENGRFVESSNPFNIKRNYAVYVRGLAPSLDEVDIEEQLKQSRCPLPFAIKINRNAEIAIPKTDTQTNEEALLSYAKSKGFLPFQDKIIETFIKKDARCKLVNISARYQTMDDVEMVFVTQPSMYHLEQTVRFQAQFKISLRVEKKLWQFRETQIKAYLDDMKAERISFRINSKSPTHIWLFVEAPRLAFLDIIRKKVDEYLHFKFYKHAQLDLLFTRYGNAQLLILDVKPGFIHINFAAKRIRIYGDDEQRSHVITLLDGLVQQLQGLQDKDCRLHRLYILDEICLLRCPRCKTPFDDFTGCCALTCDMPRCNAGFCFFCLQDCGTDAHSHVRTCTRNPNPGNYYIESSKKNTIHKDTRKRAIIQYLTNKCDDRAMRSTVLHSIVKDLKDLEIAIEPNEVGLTGFTAIADTSKHRQHILDEICTLRCPHCHEAFDDFDGCCAIECWSERCKTHFCFFCLEDCGCGFDGEQKSHAHVIKCAQNVKPGQLSITPPEIKAFNQRRRKLAIIKYLKENFHDQSERRAVIDSVAINLNHLGVLIFLEDVISSLNRTMPAAQRYVPVQPPRANVPIVPPPINLFPQPLMRDPLILPNHLAPPILPNRPAPPQQQIPRPRQPNDKCTFL